MTKREYTDAEIDTATDLAREWWGTTHDADDELTDDEWHDYLHRALDVVTDPSWDGPEGLPEDLKGAFES